VKIVFIGAVEFSRKALQKLIALKAHIVGVVTLPKAEMNADFVDLTDLCQKYKILFRLVENINEVENAMWIKDLQPDIIFCLGFPQILKENILTAAPMGVVGYHPTKLPQNRGRHPIVWALALGLRKTASTFFFMDRGADSGDIISQVDVPINYQDNARTLYNKITNVALRQIELFLPNLKKGSYKRKPQDSTKANYWRRREKSDGQIDFRMSSRSIYNLVRALTHPYVGAHVVYHDKEIKIWEVREKKVHWPNVEYAKVLSVKNREILVKCSDEGVLLVKHEFKQLPKLGEYLR